MHDWNDTLASEAHPKFVVVGEGCREEYAHNPIKLHKIEDDAT